MRNVLVLACAFALNGQITATLQQSESVSEVRIRNDSASSLIAFVVAARQTPMSPYASKAPLVLYSDPLIDGETRPVAAGDGRVVMATGFRDRSGKPYPLQEPVLAAGIFEDGTTAGDTTLLMRLLFRRSNMLLAVETALETLADAGRRNIPREQLVRQFRKMAEFLNRGYLSPEQRVGRELYQSIAGKLMTLPAEPVGAAFPPSSFVQQETAGLNRQRVTLLESQPSLVDGAFVERRIDPTLDRRVQK